MRKTSILPTLGARQPKWKLDYIREFAPSRTMMQIKQATDLSDCFIYDYCALHNIPLVKNIHRTKEYRIQKKEIVKLMPSLPERETKFTRPPAKYDNPQHEEIIEKYLKMEI